MPEQGFLNEGFHFGLRRLQTEITHGLLQGETIHHEIISGTSTKDTGIFVQGLGVAGGAHRKTSNEAGMSLFELGALALVKFLAVGLKDDRTTNTQSAGACTKEDKPNKNENQDGNHQEGIFTKGLKHGDVVSLFIREPGGRRSKAGSCQGSRGITCQDGCLTAALTGGA